MPPTGRPTRRAVNPIEFIIPVPQRPVYVPNSGPPLAPISLVPEHEDTGWRIYSIVQFQHLPHFLVCPKDNPAHRRLVRLEHITDWVSQKEYEDFEYARYLLDIQREEREIDSEINEKTEVRDAVRRRPGRPFKTDKALSSTALLSDVESSGLNGRTSADEDERDDSSGISVVTDQKSAKRKRVPDSEDEDSDRSRLSSGNMWKREVRKTSLLGPSLLRPSLSQPVFPMFDGYSGETSEDEANRGIDTDTAGNDDFIYFDDDIGDTFVAPSILNPLKRQNSLSGAGKSGGTIPAFTISAKPTGNPIIETPILPPVTYSARLLEKPALESPRIVATIKTKAQTPIPPPARKISRPTTGSQPTALSRSGIAMSFAGNQDSGGKGSRGVSIAVDRSTSESKSETSNLALHERSLSRETPFSIGADIGEQVSVKSDRSKIYRNGDQNAHSRTPTADHIKPKKFNFEPDREFHTKSARKESSSTVSKPSKKRRKMCSDEHYGTDDSQDKEDRNYVTHLHGNIPSLRKRGQKSQAQEQSLFVGDISDLQEFPLDEDDEDDDVNEEVWEVKELLDEELRTDPQGDLVTYYLVDWEGNWPASWEPHYNISDEAIAVYREGLGGLSFDGSADRRKPRRSGSLKTIPQKNPLRPREDSIVPDVQIRRKKRRRDIFDVGKAIPIDLEISDSSMEQNPRRRQGGHEKNDFTSDREIPAPVRTKTILITESDRPPEYSPIDDLEEAEDRENISDDSEANPEDNEHRGDEVLPDATFDLDDSSGENSDSNRLGNFQGIEESFPENPALVASDNMVAARASQPPMSSGLFSMVANIFGHRLKNKNTP